MGLVIRNSDQRKLHLPHQKIFFPMQAAVQALSRHPKRPSVQYSYGTAGFRFEVDEKYASAVFFRAGLLACARSVFLGRVVGLCVTASHNPVKDNGIKLIDPDGGMLSSSWEAVATRVANAETAQECLDVLVQCCGADKLFAGKGNVLVARDTRPHSERLEQAAMEGVSCLGSTARSIGVATTPQLHYCVMRENKLGYLDTPGHLAGYYQVHASRFSVLVPGKTDQAIQVDCANGVGALMFPELLKSLPEDSLTCILFNKDTTNFEGLNQACGAEHVQKTQSPPTGMPKAEFEQNCSFDGDADRIVFYSTTGGQFQLLDGDKIACLFSLFIKKHIDQVFGETAKKDVRIGTIQTAYANGSSTHYLQQHLGIEAPKVKTGVKHLHHRALDYDVGVYFEANGHGTVLFKPAFVEKLRKEGWAKNETARVKLLAFCELLNQATGDAISDLLGVSAALHVLGFSYRDWNALYQDLPSKQTKVKVSDRSLFVTNDDESQLVEPADIQAKLQAAMEKVSKGRVFIRPSGTEDVVRIYAEAETQEQANELANVAEQSIKDQPGQSKRQKQ